MCPNEFKQIVDRYLNFRDGIRSIGEQEDKSKEKLDNYFVEKIKNNISRFIDRLLKAIEKNSIYKSNNELSEDYLGQIYRGLYISFSCYGNEIIVHQPSKKDEQLKELLNNLKENIKKKSFASEIVDEIEDSFKKDLKLQCRIY